MKSSSFRKNLVYIQTKVIYIGKKVNQLIANQVTRCLNSVMNILYKLSTFFLVNICTFSFLSEKDSCQTDMHKGTKLTKNVRLPRVKCSKLFYRDARKQR